MPEVFKFTVNAELEYLKAVRTFINDSGNTLGVKNDILGDLCLVVDEAVTNIILHGYQGAGGSVDIEMKRDGSDVVISIRDQADHFDAKDVEIPRLGTSLAERDFGGMGIFLINKLTDEATFRELPGRGNELRLVKHKAF